VTGDPLRRLPTTARLWAAAVLCALPLGLTWTTRTSSTFGYTIYGTCGYDSDIYGACTPDTYIPGTFSAEHVTGAASPARLFLVFAALALGWVATRPRTARTRRIARLATGAALFALVLALAARAVPAVLCLAAALALAAPPAWPGRSRRPVFGKSTGSR
jgi:hypothetical protein